MNHKPVRKITNRGTKKITGVFPSQKNHRLIEYESLLELDYLHLLEFDNDVIDYEEQPLSIQFLYSGKRFKYTPDLSVQRKSKSQLIEVKPYNELQKLLNDNLWISKFNAAANYCKHNGYSEFLIVTEKEIRNGSKLKNIKYLFSFHNLKVPSSIKLAIRNELIINGPLQISQILERTNVDNNINTYYSYILSMLYNHEINTDLSIPVGKDSIAWINYRGR